MRLSVHKPFAALLGLLLLAAATAAQAGEAKGLFINLTSGELNRAAMAISFGHRVLKEKRLPTTLFLNVDAVRLASRNIPSQTPAGGRSVHQMLKDFMADGGKVIACPMCMANVAGMKQADLLEGVVMGSAEVTWPALLGDDVRVLSY
jgi:sulfur relay (sulfurtransferase) complex TusBCD TusD component (DsrE family)